MSARPLVTVGIPAYQAGASIVRAVVSALSQTWRPVEVLVVDDGSTDDTSALVAGLAARHPEVRLVRHADNAGTAAARNTVIAEARGEFIAFFDHDDTSAPGRIAAQWARLIDHEQRFSGTAPALCHTSYRMVFPDGRQRTIPAIGTAPDRPGPHGRALLDHLLLGRPVPGGGRGAATLTQFGRASTYRQLGGFDPVFRRQQDTELNVRLARAGGYLVAVDEVLVTQFVTPAPSKAWSVERELHAVLLDKHRQAFPSHGAYAFARRWSEARFAWYQGEVRRALGHLGVACLVAPAATVTRLFRATISVGDKVVGRPGRYRHAL